MRFTLFAFLVFSLFAATASAQTKIRKTPKSLAEKTSGKIVYESDADMLRDLQAKVHVVESKKDWTEFNRQSPIANLNKTRAAYVAQFKMENESEATMDVIIIHDKATDKMLEIRGIEDFPWRPFSDLKWISDDVLQFDQWVNPNNGGRYQVNLKTGKIVAAGYVRSN